MFLAGGLRVVRSDIRLSDDATFGCKSACTTDRKKVRTEKPWETGTVNGEK